MRVSRRWIMGLGLVAFLFLMAMLLNSLLTAYVEGTDFRKMMASQVSQSFNIEGQFAPVRRTGWFEVKSANFQGDRGTRAVKRLEADRIRAIFTPSGIFHRRWQIDEMNIDGGFVEFQKIRGKPFPKKPKPWYQFLLPEYVYLKRVNVRTADAIWKFRGKTAGMFGLKLFVTPRLRDFEYDAHEGLFRMAPAPEMKVDHLHMLITKPQLFLDELALSSLEPGSSGKIVVVGGAGLQEEQTMNCRVQLTDLPISPWFSPKWRGGVEGLGFGRIRWKGSSRGWAGSRATGSLQIAGGRIHGLPLLEQLASITRNSDWRDIHLNQFGFQLEWKHPDLHVRQLVARCEGLFRMEGDIEIHHQQLGGALEFGITQHDLEQIPKAEEVFNRERDGYWWTTVHLSGTVQKPVQDLTPRIASAIKESPTAILSLFFRAVQEWFEDLFED